MFDAAELRVVGWILKASLVEMGTGCTNHISESAARHRSTLKPLVQNVSSYPQIMLVTCAMLISRLSTMHGV